MSYGRPANYPYPREFKNIKDVEDYSKKLYAAMIENDRVGEAATRPVMNRQGWVFPQDYGAVGNGVNDDTTALKSCFTYACSVSRPVFFPAGTYLISPTTGAYVSTLNLTKGITIVGAGVGITTIKVKASGGAYFSILGGGVGIDLSNLDVSGITFDHNNTNNQHAADPDSNPTTDSERTINAFGGSNIRIHDIEVKDACSVNNIVVNSTTSTDVWITGNRFTDIGDSRNATPHDASVIYTNANNVVIADNIFNGVAVAVEGCYTAIETHGSDTAVYGNVINNFHIGMNITGIDAADCKNVLVFGNAVSNAANGILLWSQTSGAHTTGYGFDGLSVVNNDIHLDTVDTYGAGTLITGISFVSSVSAEMDSTNVTIAGNSIRTTLDSLGANQNNVSFGIGFASLASPNKTLSNTRIIGNTIVNFPMCGIRLSCGLTDVVVEGNNLINCGSTTASETEAYRDPISVISATIVDLSVSRNRIVETNATTRPAYLIYFWQGAGLTASGVDVLDNEFVVTGTGVTNHIFMENSTGTLLPFVRGHINTPALTSAANQKYSKGSYVIDSSTGLTYEVGSDQYTWTTSKTFAGITLAAGAVRSIVHADNTYYVNYCGGTSATTGAVFQPFGGAHATNPGEAYIISGTSGSNTSAFFEYGHRNTSGYAAKVRINKDANVGVGSTAYGASATQTIIQKTGTAPTGDVADCYQQYSSDFAAGNACPTFRTENGTVCQINQSLVTTATPTFAGASFTDQPRTSPSLYRRYYHIPLGSSNPGASGATWVDGDANTTGGWQLNAAGEKIRGGTDIHADWDGASDMKVEVRFNVNVDNTGGAAGDTVDLKLVCYYKGIGDTATKTQTVEVPTTVGASAQYKAFKADFTLDYDAVSNVLEVGDHISFYLNLETDTSEVDDVIVTGMSFSYLTTHIGIEDGDE